MSDLFHVRVIYSFIIITYLIILYDAKEKTDIRLYGTFAYKVRYSDSLMH
jgi:hypothetical protein